jgi:hypothetical protein
MRTVMREVLEPRMQYLLGLAAEISSIAADDPRRLRAILSIQGQILVFCATLAPQLAGGAASDTAVVADHIADFSLAALRALAALHQ